MDIKKKFCKCVRFPFWGRLHMYMQIARTLTMSSSHHDISFNIFKREADDRPRRLLPNQDDLRSGTHPNLTVAYQRKTIISLILTAVVMISLIERRWQPYRLHSPQVRLSLREKEEGVSDT